MKGDGTRFGRSSGLAADPGSPIAAMLANDERLYWAGRPKRGAVLKTLDWLHGPVILLAIVGTVLVWRDTLPASGDPLSTTTKQIVLAFTSALVLRRFPGDMLRRARLRYAVTDRRVIMHAMGPFGWTQSISLPDLPRSMIVWDTRKHGSIIFGSQEFAAKGAPADPRFELIEKPDDVLAIIEEAATQSHDNGRLSS